MKRICSALLTLLLFAIEAAAGPAAHPTTPNVILILADDMGIGDLSHLNGGLNDTPSLDRLAATSVRFDRAYSSSPVCAPARASLLTGRYPHRTGVVTLNAERFPDLARLRLDEVTLADRFRAGGYQTGLVGKWHLGHGDAYSPDERGFDETFYFAFGHKFPSYFDFWVTENGKRVDYKGGSYLTDVLTEQAKGFISRNQDRPFFLHLAHYAPHRPLSAPAELIEKYEQRGFAPDIATTYAMIEVMDRGIGEVMDHLVSLGLENDTIVIFSSDNGPDPVIGPDRDQAERFNLNLKGAKYWVNEGGIRVPFFVKHPEMESKTATDLIQFIDVVPTLMDLCELPPISNALPIDGHSFTGLLSGEAGRPQNREATFWQWNRKLPDPTHNGAVRAGKWKLIKPFVTKNHLKGPSAAPYQLFDMTKDPEERHDLADQHPEVTRKLIDQYESWHAEVEAERRR